MTDNEIIKALEYCLSQGYISDCEKCQYFAIDCRDKLIEQALDLINRQKEEIEFLRKTIGENAQRALEVTLEEIEKSRVEAITEFAEKLKEKADTEIFEEYLPSGERYQLEYKMVNIEDIDDLVKEMVGDNND